MNGMVQTQCDETDNSTTWMTMHRSLDMRSKQLQIVSVIMFALTYKKFANVLKVSELLVTPQLFAARN